MREIIFIAIVGVLVYFAFATILGDTALMGSFGASFATYNHTFFGYVSYIYIFAIIAPVYSFYRYNLSTIEKYELVISSFLLFFSALIFQAIVLDGAMRGSVGGGFVDFLKPLIGIFGVWIVWLMLLSVSFFLLLNKTPLDILRSLLKDAKPKVTIDSNFEEKTKQDKPIAVKEQELKPVSPKEIKETKENISDDLIDSGAEFKQDIKIKQEIISKPKNILNIVSDIKEQRGAIVVDELEENAKLLESIDRGEVEKPKDFKLPSSDFLQKPPKKIQNIDEKELDDKIKFLLEKLAHFKIDGDVIRTYAGPVVSTFEFKPAANVKVSRILNLQDDLAMALSAQTIRIQAPIPGKDVVGIEIPNETIDTIYLRELIESEIFTTSSSPLTIVLGKDIVGKPFVTDLKKLPHLLIAGTTGSGKSVGINAMILSLLYKNSPDQLRLLMIDPKMLEFSIYNDIPHLLTPVITKAKQAIVALNNMVGEMERRYSLMSQTKTKNIENYNEKVKKDGGEYFPYIVVIIDELADLMMTSGKDVEYSIARLAQMARASGIHLVVATQRPSVDVVTGLIKANLPSRISYRVGQKVDSKIILDQMGAESLLGRGDMLFTPPGATGLVRLHAPWSSESEIEKIVNFIKSQREPNYDKSFLLEDEQSSNRGDGDVFEELDPMFDEAKNVVLSERKTSISYLQRRLQIGYNKAARLIEQLESEGVISAPNSKGLREIL